MYHGEKKLFPGLFGIMRNIANSRNGVGQAGGTCFGICETNWRGHIAQPEVMEACVSVGEQGAGIRDPTRSGPLVQSAGSC